MLDWCRPAGLVTAPKRAMVQSFVARRGPVIGYLGRTPATGWFEREESAVGDSAADPRVHVASAAKIAASVLDARANDVQRVMVQLQVE